MSLYNLKKTLESLKDMPIKVDPRWEASTRSLILKRIEETGAAPFSTYSFIKFMAVRLTKPVAVSLAMFLSITAGLVTTVEAAQNALPGEKLYLVKRSWEQLKYNLAVEDAKKAQLEVRTAQRRVEELSALVRQPGTNRDVLDQAVIDLHRGISQVKYRLDTVKVEDSDQATQIAQTIDNHIDSYAQALKDVKKDIDQVADPAVKAEVGKKVNLAILNLENAGIEAVSVIAEKQANGKGTVSAATLKTSFEAKLNAIKETLNDDKAKLEALVKNSKDFSADNLKILGEAKDLLAKAQQDIDDAAKLVEAGSLSAAVDKLAEAQDFVQKLEQRIEKLTPPAPAVKTNDNVKAPDNTNGAPLNADTNANINAAVNSNTNVNSAVNTNSDAGKTNSNSNSNSNVNAGKVSLTPVN